MRFWRTEMAAVAPGDAFDKQYAYNIRHNYGKEGKRADYTPHSCIKVISGIPGPGQVHGCPFRVLSEEDLRTSLGKLSLGHLGVGFQQTQGIQLALFRHGISKLQG